MSVVRRGLKIAGVVAAAGYIAKKYIAPLMNADHAVEREEAPDAFLFPNFFMNAQKLWIYTQRWKVANAVGAVFLCHGLGEHVGRYEHVARALNAKGYSVYGMDHQGHGQSDGDRAYSKEFSHMVDDFIKFVESVDVCGLPRFLLGHSMGGCLAVHITAAAPDLFKAVVFSAPAVYADPATVAPAKIALARVAARVFPKALDAPLAASGISSVAQVVTRYQSDPLVYTGGLKLRFALNLLAHMQAAPAVAKKIVLPALVVHGEADPICLPIGSTLLLEALSSQDKSIKMYAGLRHEIFNETKANECINDVVTWIADRT